MIIIQNKNCSSCNRGYKISLYPLEPKRSNGTAFKKYENGRGCYSFDLCYQCYRIRLNKLRDPNNQKRYEKTLKGYLVRMYRNMLSRVTGVQKKKKHLYFGLNILPKNEFYKIALSDKNFLKLFKRYKKSNWKQGLAPSVDRINPDLGYTRENIRFVTHSENSKNVRRIKK